MTLNPIEILRRDQILTDSLPEAIGLCCAYEPYRLNVRHTVSISIFGRRRCAPARCGSFCDRDPEFSRVEHTLQVEASSQSGNEQANNSCQGKVGTRST